jgi:hypothetical protein
MKLINFHGSEGIRAGLVHDGGVEDLAASNLWQGPAPVALSDISALAARIGAPASPLVPMESLRLAPVVVEPEKIICVGLISALIQQLTKLREMTVANGCTENETNVAAQNAQSLMDQYGVTLEDIKATTIPDDLCERVACGDSSRKTLHEVQYTAVTLGKYTNCKVWTQAHQIMFFGLSADVQVAKYLLGVFQTAMDVEFAQYWKTAQHLSDVHGRTARKGFMLGMAKRLRERLNELIIERDMKREDESNDCRALLSLRVRLSRKHSSQSALNCDQLVEEQERET